MTDSTPQNPLKQCSRKDKCVNPMGCWLPATTEFFHKNPTGKHGLMSYCKECGREAYRQYRIKNKEKERERNRKRRVEHPEKIRAEYKRWYEKNRDYCLSRSKEWARNNKDHINALRRKRYALNPEGRLSQNRKWKAANRDYVHANVRNRKAKKRQSEGKHTASDIKKQLKRQRGKCYYCGCKLTRTPNLPHSQTVEHTIPLSRGGTNTIDNIVVACLRCNTSKGAKLPHEWQQGGRLL